MEEDVVLIDGEAFSDDGKGWLSMMNHAAERFRSLAALTAEARRDIM